MSATSSFEAQLQRDIEDLGLTMAFMAVCKYLSKCDQGFEATALEFLSEIVRQSSPKTDLGKAKMQPATDYARDMIVGAMKDRSPMN